MRYASDTNNVMDLPVRKTDAQKKCSTIDQNDEIRRLAMNFCRLQRFAIISAMLVRAEGHRLQTAAVLYHCSRAGLSEKRTHLLTAQLFQFILNYEQNSYAVHLLHDDPDCKVVYRTTASEKRTHFMIIHITNEGIFVNAYELTTKFVGSSEMAA